MKSETLIKERIEKICHPPTGGQLLGQPTVRGGGALGY